MLYAVIMAGGVGTRFWPMSRRQLPKQLLAITGKQSLLQESVARIRKDIRPERTLVLTNRAYLAKVKRQLPAVPLRNIIGEPVGRNTAPCIGVASVLIEQQDPKACVAVLTADHYVQPPLRFRRCLQAAARHAQEYGRVVTFGIRPTYPATGYGYIHAGRPVSEDPVRVRLGRSFVEKPTAEVAHSFIDSGDYFWNSGMFVFTVPTILRLYQEHLPELYEGLSRIRTALGTRRERQVFETTFKAFPSISIDYGIMNKLTDFLVVEADFEWDDIGSWSALERLLPKNGDGNLTIGLAELLASSDCTVVSDKEHLVALIGLHDLIVVHTGDATLVCSKALEQQVRQLVEQLRAKKRSRYL